MGSCSVLMTDSLSTDQFQKLNPVEFALTRPDAVIGSTSPTDMMLPVVNSTKLELQQVSISQGTG